jgi:hypothetical protein
MESLKRVVKKAVEIGGGFITPHRGVEVRRATAREIDEEVQIDIPRISAAPRALQFAHRGCASRSTAAEKPKDRRAIKSIAVLVAISLLFSSLIMRLHL